MQDRRRDWCRSLIAALLTVTTCAAAIAQRTDRLSGRSTDFSDVERIIRDGSDSSRGFGTGQGGYGAAAPVDLSRVDKRTVRNLLSESVLESERLYKSLQNDYRRYPEIRPLFSDLISLRARATRLTEDMDDNVSLERLVPNFKQLDSDWQLLSHRMSQTRQLSNTSRDSADRIGRIGRELQKLFQMEPQLDRRALLQALSDLDSSVRYLVQDLETDSGGSSKIYDLILDTRKLQQQAHRVQEMVLDRYSYATIVDEYNRFSSMWAPIASNLQRLNNRYVERSVRNIRLADYSIHDLLWLEHQTDRENLKQISDDLMRDVEEFFTRVPLKLLLRFKDVNHVMETSDSFYGTVQNFQDCVSRNEKEDVMLECYGFVEDYGEDFVRAFEPLRSQAGRIVLREIEDGIVALRNELNLSGTVTSVDTRAMIPTAASLENLADHLRYDVRQWLNRERPQYRTAAMEAVDRFVQRSRRLHRILQSHPSSAELKKELSNLTSSFRTVYEEYLGRCRTEHRDHLKLLSEDISDAIYELRAPLRL